MSLVHHTSAGGRAWSPLLALAAPRGELAGLSGAGGLAGPSVCDAWSVGARTTVDATAGRRTEVALLTAVGCGRSWRRAVSS